MDKKKHLSEIIDRLGSYGVIVDLSQFDQMTVEDDDSNMAGGWGREENNGQKLADDARPVRLRHNKK